MIREGHIVLLSVPRVDQTPGKLRPALVLRALPGPHRDWLICMISSQLRHQMPEIDEVIHDTDPDFPETGLRTTSLVRATRLAVASEDIIQGYIGSISDDRLRRMRDRLSAWIGGD